MRKKPPKRLMDRFLPEFLDLPNFKLEKTKPDTCKDCFKKHLVDIDINIENLPIFCERLSWYLKW